MKRQVPSPNRQFIRQTVNRQHTAAMQQACGFLDQVKCIRFQLVIPRPPRAPSVRGVKPRADDNQTLAFVRPAGKQVLLRLVGGMSGSRRHRNRLCRRIPSAKKYSGAVSMTAKKPLSVRGGRLGFARATEPNRLPCPRMSQAQAVSLAEPAASAENLCDRKHRLTPPKSLWGRLGLKAQDALESFIARVSVHGDPPIYDAGTFPWTAELEAGWKKIRAELDQVLQYRDQMPSFQDILKEVSTIQTDNDWKTFFLAGIGMDCSENARRCPETMRLLGRIPGMKTAFFSILSPRKHIPAHRGAYNGVLRFHLGLLVPEPRERVRIRCPSGIGAQQCLQTLVAIQRHEMLDDE